VEKDTQMATKGCYDKEMMAGDEQGIDDELNEVTLGGH
jgi:hypothetical protein